MTWHSIEQGGHWVSFARCLTGAGGGGGGGAAAAARGGGGGGGASSVLSQVGAGVAYIGSYLFSWGSASSPSATLLSPRSGGGGGAAAVAPAPATAAPALRASWRFFNDLAGGYESPYPSGVHARPHTFTPGVTSLLTSTDVDAFIRRLHSSYCSVEVACIVYERTRGPP